MMLLELYFNDIFLLLIFAVKGTFIAAFLLLLNYKWYSVVGQCAVLKFIIDCRLK